MAIDFAFRRKAVRSLVNQIGVYVLCDLNKVPIYVGQSTDGIRSRVARHLTSARSDIIANRQIDVWEIAWVLTYPVETKAEITPLEGLLFHHFNAKSQLMNGSIPPAPAKGTKIPKPAQAIQVMSDEEIVDKIDPSQRLPRQAGHYTQIVGHFLTVKNSPQVARAMDAHFKRLARYHGELLGLTGESDPGDE
ncbi:GIY-YIG nuclease family protein [Sphingomonas sp. T1]|uniref:GIY-YIG nuclease family protein n=1 Tax=Sphingomonas sp. T1 TaxID=2653172 RepID=UPI0013584629|nr:GIY-YIG nuclease family protein [Sphingomonas sp. T1]